MATIDYVEIPASATRLQSCASQGTSDLRPAVKVVTSLPHPESTPRGTPSTPASAQSPTAAATAKSGFSLQQALLSSTFQLPANAPSAPRATKGTPKLLSTRDPLSIPITTANFRRFVAKVGPVFWLQDRLEEIVMWRRGWKYTAVWMCAYAFLCYYPRLALLLPVVAVLGVLLGSHSCLRNGGDVAASSQPAKVPPPPPAQVSDWSMDWLANVQAIQNLMGAFSDAHDQVYPIVPHLNHSSPYTPVIFSLTVATLVVSVPMVALIPLRTTFLVLGLTPFALTHPFTMYTLYPIIFEMTAGHLATLHVRLTRLVDNDRLEDKHWRSELREVELWENERWAGVSGTDDGGTGDAGWSKANLRPGERKAWTRGRDGWSGVSDDGSGDVSNLTFSLSPGWLFVETEDWRPDLEASWIGCEHADQDGWVYTDDVWMHPSSAPRDVWKQSSGMTRRRRWVRRIYYDPAAAG
ncbi:uncharacterized protein PHACADRAFT_262101 [Phanerochaete carnosa HHB-10118-sp]|uniref:TECPR1-like DysF domain-containing protein n=1 Tax=Phanerochaete carnosa (strain HHB-10118-sp) TaxID=650164 RepID=K5VYT6_PHACS|nr:uncharacterized protein PHACADRAFT_262101 [Phanerochaete carnosa HHB-10118-sp]EKM51769.1 hypothetical protein PHACADRAFT_262101 [Phanerochaete carnosa HHB-10118-sp]